MTTVDRPPAQARPFELVSDFQMTGDQPQAVAAGCGFQHGESGAGERAATATHTGFAKGRGEARAAGGFGAREREASAAVAAGRYAVTLPGLGDEQGYAFWADEDGLVLESYDGLDRSRLWMRLVECHREVV